MLIYDKICDSLFESLDNKEKADSFSRASETIIYLTNKKRKRKLSNSDYKIIKNDDELILNNSNCSICIEPYIPKQYKRTLDCKHTFHKKCLDSWLSNYSAQCPLCRKDFRDKMI